MSESLKCIVFLVALFSCGESQQIWGDTASCLVAIDEWKSAVVGRPVVVEVATKKFAANGELSLPSARKAPLTGSWKAQYHVTVWVPEYKLKIIRGDQVEFQTASVSGRSLTYEGEGAEPLPLKASYYTVELAGPFFCILDGSSRMTSGPRFEQWMNPGLWTHSRSGDTEKLSMRRGTEKLDLLFSSEGRPRLVHIDYEGAVKSSDAGQEQSTIRFKDAFQFTYDEKQSVIAHPIGWTALQLTYSNGKTSLLESVGKVLEVGEPTPKIKNFGDAQLDIPEGAMIASDQEPGIEYEWRNNSVQKKIDSGALGLLSSGGFRSARWSMLWGYIIIIGIGGVAWWLRSKR